MQKIFYNGREHEIPERIEELSTDQYLAYLSLWSKTMIFQDYNWAFADVAQIQMPSGAVLVPLADPRLNWLMTLLGISQPGLLADGRLLELWEARHSVEGFIKRDDDGKWDFTLDTLVNLWPEFGEYRGPGEWLEGVKFGEFTECLAVLGGPDSAGGTVPEEACEHIARVLYHVPEGVALPPGLPWHATRLFINVWHAIQSGPVMINGQPVDFRIIFAPAKDQRARPDDGTAWTGITFEIAKEGPFGNVKEVEASDMWQVLLWLYKCKFEYIHDRDRRANS